MEIKLSEVQLSNDEIIAMMESVKDFSESIIDIVKKNGCITKDDYMGVGKRIQKETFFEFDVVKILKVIYGQTFGYK